MEDIVKYNTNKMLSIEEIKTTADHFILSKLFNDVKQISEAVVKIQAGQEIGLKPFQSMSGFDIIQGKMVLKPYAMAGIVKQSGKYTFTVKEHTNEICILEWYENNKRIGESSFSFEDAKNANLLGKQVWKQYTKDMLYNRALSRGCRWFAMDAFMMPVYIEHEIEETPKEQIKETPYKEVKKVVAERVAMPTDKLIKALKDKTDYYSKTIIESQDNFTDPKPIHKRLFDIAGSEELIDYFTLAIFDVNYKKLEQKHYYALDLWLSKTNDEIGKIELFEVINNGVKVA